MQGILGSRAVGRLLVALAVLGVFALCSFSPMEAFADGLGSRAGRTIRGAGRVAVGVKQGVGERLRGIGDRIRNWRPLGRGGC